MINLQNPTDNKGYMPLKRHIAITDRLNYKPGSGWKIEITFEGIEDKTD